MKEKIDGNEEPPEPSKAETDPYSTPAPVKRLRIVNGVPQGELGKPGTALPKLPTREEIAQLAVDAYRLALDNVRTFKNKRGEMTREKAPDFRGACEALRVLAAVSGHTAKAYPSAYEAEETRRRKEEAEALKALSKSADEARIEEVKTVEEVLREKEEELLDAQAVLGRLRSRTALEEEEGREDE